MKIVLDSNIIIADYHLSSPLMRILTAFLQRTNSTLLLPKIVIEEVTNKYREHLTDVINKFTQSAKRLQYLDASFNDEKKQEYIENLSEDIAIKVEVYSKQLESRLNLLEADYIDYPSVMHESVARRAIEKRKPFTSSGKGYRDTIIWESILEEAKSVGKIVFITRNIKDYMEEDGTSIHADLKNDMKAEGIQEDQIEFYPSLEVFMDSVVKPQLARLDDFMHTLFHGDYAPLNLIKFLEEREDEIVSTINEYLPNILSDSRFHDPTVDVDNLAWSGEIDSLDVLQSDENELWVHFRTDYYADVDFYINEQDRDLLNEDNMYQYSIHYFKMELEWDKRTIRGKREVAIGFYGDIVLDSKAGMIKSYKFYAMDD